MEKKESKRSWKKDESADQDYALDVVSWNRNLWSRSVNKTTKLQSQDYSPNAGACAEKKIRSPHEGVIVIIKKSTVANSYFYMLNTMI